MTPASGRHRRVYLRVGRQGLALLAAGDSLPAAEDSLPAAGLRGYAVTDLVRLAFPGQDEEELEYEAMCVAAESAPVGAPDAGGPAKVVVVAADVPAARVREVVSQTAGPVPAEEAFAIEIAEPLRARQVVSAHVQDDADGPDAELQWYDVSELAALVAPPD